VRPTDEDQPGLRRPNLMSSNRRSANEVNILDMLDRQASGPLPRRMLRRLLKRPARFWYGSAGLLICTLVGALAWLARDGGPAPADTLLAGSIKPAALAPEVVTETVVNAPLEASAAEPAAAPDSAAAGATIVELAPQAEPEAPGPAAPAVPAALAPAQMLPQQQAAGRIASHAAPHDPPGPAVHALPARAAPRAGRSAALAHAEQAPPRNQRQPAPAKPVPAVDTDVALITAIIQHASARQEAQEACDGKACDTRKP
jgi:hypothetical protein